MARCPNCKKFVSYGKNYEPEITSCDVEIEDAELKDNGIITEINAILRGEVRIRLDCAECSTELRKANLEFKIRFIHACPGDKGGIALKIESSEAELTSRQHTLNNKGRAIRDPRYWKTFHGAHLDFQVKCGGCDKVIDLETTVEEQASHFKEL